jgi:hypothetical protein
MRRNPDLSTRGIVRVIIALSGGLAGTRVVGAVRAGSAWRHGLFDGLALLGGAALIVLGFILLRRRQLLANVPTSRVRSVAMGFAEVAGLARAKATVAAPYSGIPCVYFRYQVEEERSRGRGRRTWVTIEKGDSGVPFHLQDTTGRILVDPAGAETLLRQSFRKIERGEGFFSRRTRYTEWWIVSAQKVFVVGTVRRVRDLALERRVTLHDRLRELKADSERMSAFDTDRDGRISTEEWGNAVRAVKDDVLRDAAAAPAAPPEDEVLIGKGSDETTFLISDRSEKWLLGRLALQSGGALAGGAAMVVVFGVSLLARAGVVQGGWIIPW